MATTPEEFEKQMKQIKDMVGDDEQAAHEEMDSLMEKVLVELGYQDGVAIFKDQDKLYS